MSRSGKGGGQQDQKKIYIDWANHYLRKAGHSDVVLSDLKDISDGSYLPKVVQAVVQNPVPGIHASPSTDAQRLENIECCVRYLEKMGVKCSNCAAKDISDGNMRAILSLFYSLSQHKRTKSGSTSSIGGRDGDHPPSKISRPISPGPRSPYAVKTPSIDGDTHPPSRISRPVSPGLKSTLGISPHITSSEPRLSSSAPKGTSQLSSPAALRRTAGSTIMTSTTFDRPFTQRRVPYKPINITGEKPEEDGKKEKESVVAAPSHEGEDAKVANGHPILENGIDADPKLHVSAISRSTSKLPSSSLVSEAHHAPAGRSLTMPAVSLSKLAVAAKGDVPKETGANEESQSRLKYPGGVRTTTPSARTLSEPGRSTPTAGRSGLVRPTSRLAKPSQVVDKVGRDQGKGEGSQQNGVESSSSGGVSKLKLERKSSGGMAKRHGVESGISSLPRNISRSVTSAGSGLAAPSSYSGTKKHGTVTEATTLVQNSSTNKEECKSELMTSSSSGGKGDSSSNHQRSPSVEPKNKLPLHSGEKRVLRRPGASTGTTGIRTPDMPSGPVTVSTASGTAEERSDMEATPAPVEKVASHPSPSQLPKSSGATGLKYPGDRKIPLTGAKGHPQRTFQSGLRNKVGLKPRDSLSSSSDSLDSSASSEVKLVNSPGIENGHVAESKSLVAETSPVKSVARVPPPLILREGRRSSLDNGDILSPPANFSGKDLAGKELGTSSTPKPPSSKNHLRYGRRISPEGMSHEEIVINPKEDNGVGEEAVAPVSVDSTNKKKEKDFLVEGKGGDVLVVLPGGQKVEVSDIKPVDEAPAGPAAAIQAPQPPVSSVHSQTNEQTKGKEDGLTRSEEVTSTRVHCSRVEQLARPPLQNKRARSLSPSSTRRISPTKVVLDDSPSHSDTPSSPAEKRGMELLPATSSDISKSPGSPGPKRLKSSLRNGNKSRTSSSSSLDSTKSPKVTISPRSSQLVYLPDEVGLQAAPSYTMKSYLSPHHVSELQSDRPQSFVDPEFSRSADILRRASIRSTMSEKLDYRDEIGFLQPGLDLAGGEQYGSTPELLESFENQLSTMKRDLESKNRMLSMYENSMADLSSKVHLLKKSLEEKDQEIKQLTDVKHHWYDLEGRSLASRAASESGVLSDGCLSDSAVEPNSKTGKKKKKAWKRFSFRKKQKDNFDSLSVAMDTESVISSRPVRGIKRHPSRSKPSDLVSISEYSPDHRDIDAKSTYTIDFRSEYSGPPQVIQDETVEVFSDPSPGAKVAVALQLGYMDVCEGERERERRNEMGLGMLSVAPETSWVTMDNRICEIFMHHIITIDQVGELGLSDESILYYTVAEQRRAIGNAILPAVTPYEAIANRPMVKIFMKGAAQASCDSLAYKTLIGSEVLQSYMSMLMETQWLVVMGTKGTCKTSLATGLARHLAMCVTGDSDWEGRVVTFNLEIDGVESVVKYLKGDLAKRAHHHGHPPILLLDDVYDCQVLEQILAAGTCLSQRPYIISTLCPGSMNGIPLHKLLFHHQMRVITCNPQTEPTQGVLARSLRKHIFQLKAGKESIDPVAERIMTWLPYLLDYLNSFLSKFHSNSVALGPRVFMSCPLEQSSTDLEMWFINLWNHFLIPYLMGTIMAGIETYTADPRLEWVDVREWVVDMYPWQPSSNITKLRTLNPEDVGWNHAVRPQQSRLMLYKDDPKFTEDTRSMLRIKQNSECVM